MNWRTMLKDKRLWIGVAVAAAVGAGVLWQRKRDTGSTTVSGETVATSGAAAGGLAGVSGIDTTGTDIASWMSQYSGSLQRQLDEYGTSLSSTMDTYAKSLTGVQSQLTDIDKDVSGVSANMLKPVYVTKSSGSTSWSLSSVAKKYGIDIDMLRLLNPSLSKISATDPKALKAGTKIRLS